jgi:hypothetical protein
MTTYTRNNDYEAILLDDEWIILNTDNFTITKVNEAGGYCWELLQHSQNTVTLIEKIQEKFNFEAKEQDILSFISDMIRCGLVKHED